MNNSKATIGEEKEIDRTPWLRLEEKKLVEIIESIEAISSSAHWKILDKHIWSGLKDSIDKKLRNESNEKEVYRLQGQAVWTQKFTDFKSLAQFYRNQLNNVRNQINGSTKEE